MRRVIQPVISQSLRRVMHPGNIKYLVLVVICLVLASLNRNFFTLPNLMNILRQSSVLAILGVGMTFVIITRGIDLSMAGVMSLCGCVCAILLNRGWPVPLAMATATLLGAAFGCINGMLVAFVGLPPFVATYGVKFIADGLALIVMGGNILFGFPATFRFLGTGFVGALPMLVLVAFLLAAVFHVVLAYTKLGRQVYCVGANAAAAYYSGIRTTAVLLFAFTLCGAFAAIGGILQTARMNAAQAGMGDSFQMLVVASVVMGGTSMSGGEGGIPGTIVGALILTLIVNAMNLLGIPSLAQSLITGAVIILAVLMDIQVKKFEARRPLPALGAA
ncbi:MAG: ABC transporter permease [Planctomycetes bacterium]|nr:ABC transporter permease [Planctomycetota bacterium]